MKRINKLSKKKLIIKIILINKKIPNKPRNVNFNQIIYNSKLTIIKKNTLKIMTNKTIKDTTMIENPIIINIKIKNLKS